MQLTFRPLPAWPYPEQKHRPALFTATYAETLDLLEREVRYLRGDEVIVGVVTSSDSLRLDGRLRAEARITHPGVEVSFEVPGRRDPMTDRRAPGRRRLVFHADVHQHATNWALAWQHNLRAIAKGLEALRAVDRYGITSTAQQYAGFAQLTSSAPNPTRGKQLVEAAGGMKQALLTNHPDHGGDPRDFADVQAYRSRAEVAP